MKTLIPTTSKELEQMIDETIRLSGFNCSLNHIDVSLITDMSYLFSHKSFNGDISQWNVSHVKNMKYMFQGSKFNGDISDWNVSCVQNMSYMFRDSLFYHNIDRWAPIALQHHRGMFDGSPLEQPIWFNHDLKEIKNYFKKINIKNSLSHHLKTQPIEVLKIKL